MRGNAITVPGDTVQPGAANSRVRNPRCSSTRSAAISRRFASCAGKVANSPRRFLVAASSKPCSTMASTGFAPGGEPVDGGRVVVESVAALDPGSHQQRHRHIACVQLLAERPRRRCSVRSLIPEIETISCPATRSLWQLQVSQRFPTRGQKLSIRLPRQHVFDGRDHLGRVGFGARTESLHHRRHPVRAGTSRSSTGCRRASPASSGVLVSSVYSGCRSAPLTSVLASSGNVTP